MNRFHRSYCRSDHWFRLADGRLLPWAVGTLPLGDHLLELGCGPGRVTPALAALVPHVTSIDIDRQALGEVRARAPAARPVAGSAVELPFECASFSSAVACAMLHHVAGSGDQRRLVAETWRVLRPGGWFVGCDPLDGLVMRILHLGGTFRPLTPGRLERILHDSGFDDIEVATTGSYVRWRARRV